MNKSVQEIVELSGGAFSALILLSGILSPLAALLSFILEVLKWL